ncbi:MAG: tetraacyldisaccharide 4'-kinase, partial [Muribaculaceae bacterium]|nr:tetraacyldisaccharide 4'-kinase [Muribaculaceae bacterium]
DIGDEAYQIYHKFAGQVVIAVCEDRVKGINELLKIDPMINLMVLDDAFQHRYVKPTVAILITEYGRPVYSDKLLPYGRLRESVRGMGRADIVITAKCPDGIKQIDYRLVSKHLDLYPYQKLFFSRFAYQNLVPLFPDAVRTVPFLDWMGQNDTILAVAGIGNPRPFIRYLKSFLPRVKVNVFPDHHYYKRKDIELIKNRYNSMKGENRIIITTEKDAVRLVCNPYFPHELKAVTFYLPVEVEFLNYSSNDDFATTLREMLSPRHN